MKINTLLIPLTLFLCLLFSAPAVKASDEEVLSFKEYLEQANDYIKAYRHFEASDALKEATRLGGAKHPSLHMRLGILYYGLGLIAEAIAEGEKAVNLAPASKWYKYDLAKFYYVDKQLDKAEEQFVSLLKLDPGFTLGYYYLAELYFKKHEYDMAWLSLQRAKHLGHQGKRLSEKLSPLSAKPTENYQLGLQDNQLYRFIKVSSGEEAQKILEQIKQGKLFENLELELRKDKTEAADFGVMLSNELKPSVAKSLQGSKPYSSPEIIRTGPDYRIMQRIVPFNPDIWRKIALAGTSPAKPVQKSSLAITATVASGSQPDKKTTAIDEFSKTPTTQEVNSQLSNRLAAFYALERWQEAWESQNVDNYLGSYSVNFKPAKGKSLQQWKTNRQKSLSRPKFIRIKIDEPVVETLSSKQLLITFKQSYESNTYSDMVIKTLTMDKETDGWKITQEREIKKLYP